MEDENLFYSELEKVGDEAYDFLENFVVSPKDIKLGDVFIILEKSLRKWVKEKKIEALQKEIISPEAVEMEVSDAIKRWFWDKENVLDGDIK